VRGSVADADGSAAVEDADALAELVLLDDDADVAGAEGVVLEELDGAEALDGAEELDGDEELVVGGEELLVPV
jgi:hypothetical protein